MAKLRDATRWRALRDLISEEIESAMYGCYEPDEVPNEISLAISPELDEVHCLVDPSSMEVMDFIEQHEGWHIEGATTIEDAIDKADLYFDLR